MARVGRLAGALLAVTGNEVYLVGNTKVPCDWAAAGFEPPLEIDALEHPFIRLSPTRPVELAAPALALEVEGEALPTLIASIFVIARTGSVSERIWRLVIGQGEDDDDTVIPVIPARWLGEVPTSIWHIVRDTVLRCS